MYRGLSIFETKDDNGRIVEYSARINGVMQIFTTEAEAKKAIDLYIKELKEKSSWIVFGGDVRNWTGVLKLTTYDIYMLRKVV